MRTTLGHVATTLALLVACAAPALGQAAATETTSRTQQVGPGITVSGSPEFVEATMLHFDTLRQTEVGREVIRRLQDSGKSTAITETTDDNGYETPDDMSKAELLPDGTPNVGTNTRIQFNPNLEPAVATLGHELIHSMHDQLGTAAPGTVTEGRNKGQGNVEMQAMGIGEYADEALTENKLRDELNALEDDFYQEQSLAQRIGHDDFPAATQRTDEDEALAQGSDPDSDANGDDARAPYSDETESYTERMDSAPGNSYQGAANRLNDLFGDN